MLQLRRVRYALAATVFLVATSAWSSDHSLSASPPNVLMIAVDDLNDWTGYLGGHPQSRTPNIDALVNRGVHFTNAHCVAPACNPSRAALMSGVRPWKSGVYLNPSDPKSLLRHTTTINRHFLTHGYDVRGGGKIYHNRAAEGRDDTWSHWFGKSSTKGGPFKNLNGLDAKHFDWGPIPVSTKMMGDTKLTDWAIEQLKQPRGNKPLFLAVGYVKPHLPWQVPQKYFDRFPLDSVQLPIHLENDLDDLPPAALRMARPSGDHADVVRHDQWQKAVQGYLATISYLDDQIGRLMTGLDESDLAENTIIIWWSDHGWHLGEKQHWRKFALWRDATRTSFAVVAPGVTTPQTRCEAAVDYMTVYPTLCDLAGLPIPKHVHDKSLRSVLSDPDSNWDGQAICTHGRGNHAVYRGKHHLIRYADGSNELYDIVADPHEWTNLAEEPSNAPIIADLKSHLPSIDQEAADTKPQKPNRRRK